MKYKVGDKVRIKSLDWYNANKDENGIIPCSDYNFTKFMIPLCGEIVTIKDIEYESGYIILEDDMIDAWTDDMIEGLAETDKPKMVSLEDVCKFLDEHLYTDTSTGDYDYGQEYICSDFNNASDLIFALRKAMGE